MADDVPTLTMAFKMRGREVEESLSFITTWLTSTRGRDVAHDMKTDLYQPRGDSSSHKPWFYIVLVFGRL